MLISDMPLSFIIRSYVIHTWVIKLVHSLFFRCWLFHTAYAFLQDVSIAAKKRSLQELQQPAISTTTIDPQLQCSFHASRPVSHRRLPPYVHARQ
jgi:hypothetical protein